MLTKPITALDLPKSAVPASLDLPRLTGMGASSLAILTSHLMCISDSNWTMVLNIQLVDRPIHSSDRQHIMPVAFLPSIPA